MVDDLLKAFVQVIDCGSFSKAAEKLYISSTALMKQMNGLEAQVGVQLLIRTNHGIRATEAGFSFYQDAKFMMQYSEKAVVRAQQVANRKPSIIRVGNSILYPSKPLLDLWNQFSEDYPQLKMKIVPFEDDLESAATLYQTIGKDFDVMVGPYEKANGSFNYIRLGDEQFCIAVSREHRLARKERLSIIDLYGERLVLIELGASPSIDAIRSYLLMEHPEIQIKNAPCHYNIDLFNRCEEVGAAMLTLDGWKDVHPSLVTIPVNWEYTIPYGILYPPKPSNSVQLFLRAIQEAEFSSHLANPAETVLR